MFVIIFIVILSVKYIQKCTFPGAHTLAHGNSVKTLGTVNKFRF